MEAGGGDRHNRHTDQHAVAEALPGRTWESLSVEYELRLPQVWARSLFIFPISHVSEMRDGEHNKRYEFKRLNNMNRKSIEKQLKDARSSGCELRSFLREHETRIRLLENDIRNILIPMAFEAIPCKHRVRMMFKDGNRPYLRSPMPCPDYEEYEGFSCGLKNEICGRDSFMVTPPTCAICKFREEPE